MKHFNRCLYNVEKYLQEKILYKKNPNLYSLKEDKKNYNVAFSFNFGLKIEIKKIYGQKHKICKKILNELTKWMPIINQRIMH